MIERFRLRSSEWLLTGSLFILLFSLVAIAKIKASQAGAPRERKIFTVDVTINGYVKKPGVYAIARGTPLGEALKKAFPKKFADLHAIPLDDPVSHPLVFNIECLKELLIHVEGAVQNPGQIRVAPGTRISGLKKIIPLSANADPAFFKKKRMVQDGETINIPSRDR
jgi:hypothetical protein